MASSCMGFGRNTSVADPRIARPTIRSSPNSRLRSLYDLMPAAALIRYEWLTHGTCTGLSQDDYFRVLRAAREKVAIPAEFLRGGAQRLDPDAAEAAFLKANNDLPRQGIAITCDESYLRDVRICMTKELGFRSCPGIDRSACRLDKVRHAAGAWRIGLPLLAIVRAGGRSYRRLPSQHDLRESSSMPTVLYASASPYSAKVRMAAAYAGISLEARIVDTTKQPPELMSANPLGKIPVLIADDGEAIFDSRAITQYLNRLSGNRLFPRNPAKRTEAERLEALADGIADCALAHVYERRSRPEEMVHQPWLDKQWDKVLRALDHLNDSPPRLSSKVTGGQIALRATLGYLDLRFPGKWEKGRGKIRRWAARFDEKFPELKTLLPS